ncbi:myosin-2B-like [Acyrthosiphon pisum]|uniref:Myosin motor domain-containing protein n=1 Tax=Acyrthosiphon pisum TaxID=7029 RepID=A0A8R2JUH0_ACYPI|nr:myosin-2B-like [Acyrthosiphon pisum]
MPEGSDASWTQKLCTNLGKNDRFSKPKFGGMDFTIKHFAGDVKYSSDGFLDKNKDTVFEDQVCIYSIILFNIVSKHFSFYNIYLF